MKKLLASVLVLGTVSVMMATPVWADINYTFIKVTCNQPSKTAIIKAFYDWNEAGRERTKKHVKGTYYLGDISGYGEIGNGVPLRGEIKACHFENGQAVSFIAEEDKEHPGSNGLRLFLNEKQVNAFFSLANGGWTLKIHPMGFGKFYVRECTGKQSPSKLQCTNGYVVNGKIIQPVIKRKKY